MIAVLMKKKNILLYEIFIYMYHCISYKEYCSIKYK